jgi:moderate conductance mechanosensitive channel
VAGRPLHGVVHHRRGSVAPLSYHDLTDWLRDGLLPTAVLLLGALLFARLARWIGERYRHNLDARVRETIEAGRVVSEEAKRSRAIAEVVEWTVVSLTYFVAVLLAIRQLGIPLTTLVAPATVAGVALGFGAQQVVADLLAGFFLFSERQFGIGDLIRLSQPGQTAGVTGTVEQLTLRVTKLRTVTGEFVVIPNSALRQVTNLSKDWSRVVLDIPISATDDLEQATSVLVAAADSLASDDQWSGLLLGDPVVAGVETIEVGYVRLRLVVRTLPGRQFDVSRELRLRCATALREAGIVAAPMTDETATLA